MILLWEDLLILSFCIRRAADAEEFPVRISIDLGTVRGLVVGMPDGFTQASRTSAVAVLYTATSTDNGMGNIITVTLKKTPLYHYGSANPTNAYKRPFAVYRLRNFCELLLDWCKVLLQ